MMKKLASANGQESQAATLDLGFGREMRLGPPRVLSLLVGQVIFAVWLPMRTQGGRKIHLIRCE